MQVLAELLSKNEIVMIMPDAGWGERFTEVPFFSGSIRLPTGFAFLAWKCYAPIVPYFCTRKGLRYSIRIPPPFHAEGEMTAAIDDAVGAYAREVEHCLRSAPDQWLLLGQYEVERSAEGDWCLINPAHEASAFYEPEDFV